MAGAGITAKERLGRIEDVLQRIDTKLDNKADKADLVALEVRTRALESKLAKYAGAFAVLMALATTVVYLIQYAKK